MSITCLLFPALIFCCVRHKINEKKIQKDFENMVYCIIEFLCGCVSINVMILVARMLFRKRAGNIVDTLNQYSDFAVKYLLLGLLLAASLPYIEKYCKDRVTYHFHIERGSRSGWRWKPLAALLAIGMAAHHLIRIFDNSFWGDEGLAILAARETWAGMLDFVAGNGHSPFHYAFVWICCRIFGYSGVIYHFASTLPYFILIAVTLTLVWKWFGTEAVLVLTTFDTFLICAVDYNLEVRMYAWCQLFILLAYLMAYQLYEMKKIRYFILMAVFSAGAIYSHYFALATIGLLYLILLLYYIKSDQKNCWKVIASGTSVLVSFVPWIVFCYKTKGRVMSNYGIGQVSWYSCFEFIFHSRYSMALLICFFAFLTVQILYKLGILRIEKGQDGRLLVSISITPKEWALDGYLVWTLSGVCAVFGMIFISKAISFMVFPIIVLRYLYPSYIIIWLLFGISISKCRLKKLYTCALIGIVLVSCYPAYLARVKSERENGKLLERTLAATTSEIGENDFIYTDIVHFAWTVEQVYYPDTPRDLFGHKEWWGPVELPKLDRAIQYWLFLSGPISDEISENLEAQDLKAESIVDGGYIGTGAVWVYKVVSADER